VATINITRGLIGKEDVSYGNGTFTRATSTGGTQNITKLSSGVEVFNVKDYGAIGDGVVNDTAAFVLAIASGRHVYIPSGTYVLGQLAFTGLSNVRLIGDGRSVTVLDFSAVASGVALDFNFDASAGGSQNIVLEDFSLTDSRSSSLIGTMLKFQSGATGQSPAQTSAFLRVNRCGIDKFNNTSGIGRHMLDVSHVTFNDWSDAYELGVGESLVLENSININTGVYNFNNEDMRATVRPLRIKAESQLLDTINFNGGYMSQHVNASAAELVLIEGDQPITALNFHGMHWECRSNSETAVVLTTGQWRGGSFIGNHVSGGTATKQTDTLFEFTGTAKFDGVYMNGNEVLRVEGVSGGGNIFHFENTVVTDIENPCNLGSWHLNTTTPRLVEVDSGGSELTIYKSLISHPTTENRGATGPERVYELEDSATPNVEGGRVFEATSAWGSGNITDFIGEHKGQAITIINTSGGTITVTTGASTIRCKGTIDLPITNNDSVQFARTSANHWIQVGEVIST